VVLAVALIASAGLIGVLGGNRVSHVPGAAAETTAGPKSITVSGEGRVYATPDTAVVILGVQNQATDLTTAQGDAARTMNALQAAVKAKGVPDNRIKTVSYYEMINYDDKQPNRPVTGYVVTDMIQVSVKPVDQVGAVIQAALNAGANQVQGVSFTLEDTAAAVQQARQQAMDDAHGKAMQLAQLGGVTLGQPISISEGVSEPSTPQPVKSVTSAAAGAAAVAPSIEGGQTLVDVTVTVSYGF
jgi:uncharacterized protein YggE